MVADCPPAWRAIAATTSLGARMGMSSTARMMSPIRIPSAAADDPSVTAVTTTPASAGPRATPKYARRGSPPTSLCAAIAGVNSNRQQSRNANLRNTGSSRFMEQPHRIAAKNPERGEAGGERRHKEQEQGRTHKRYGIARAHAVQQRLQGLSKHQRRRGADRE